MEVMRPTVTRGATHKFQKPANWDENTDEKCGDLQVRAEVFGKGIVELYSTWEPSHAERLHLINGGVIEVGICLPNQPVMRVGVVDPIPAALRKYVAPQDDDTAPDKVRPDVWMNSLWYTEHRAVAGDAFDTKGRLISKAGLWIGLDDKLPDGEHDAPSENLAKKIAGLFGEKAKSDVVTINEDGHGE
jgi:hypothetical protein